MKISVAPKTELLVYYCCHYATFSTLRHGYSYRQKIYLRDSDLRKKVEHKGNESSITGMGLEVAGKGDAKLGKRGGV